MIPYRTVGKSDFRAYATFTIIILTFAFFIWEIGITSQAGKPITDLLPDYAFQTCEVGKESAGHVVGDGVRSLFMHLTFTTLATNMVFLWIFAPKVEQFLGHRGFFLFYILGGFGGYILTTLLIRGDCAIVVGANASIASVLGAFFFLYPLRPIDAHVPIINRTYTLPAMLYIVVYMVLVVFASGEGPLSGNLAPYWDELGGFLMGVGVMFFATLFKSAPPSDPFDYLDKD